MENFDQYIIAVNHNSSLTTLVIDQLKKDFGNLLKDEPALISNGNLYNELYHWIFPVLKTLYNTDRQRFTSLIYTIDAGFIKQRLKNRKESELEQWTHAIILRECLKVFIRINYKPEEHV